MDRPTTRKDADPQAGGLSPSRKAALDLCLASIGAGPVLLTGDAGSGKTRVRLALEADRPGGCRWACVDLTPADGPGDFHRMIARELGLAGPGMTRADVAEFLADRHLDGDRRALAVEEAHNLSAEVWEEVRVLANRLGRPDGFAALLLVGQTPLARKLATRSFGSIEARIAARVHLGPIDLDEVLTLLAETRPDRVWSEEEVEVIHRDTEGNLGRLVRLVTPGHRPLAHALAPPPLSNSMPKPTSPPRTSGPTLPARPPLRVEDHLIEVGWSPEAVPGADSDLDDEEDFEEVEDDSPTHPPQGDEAARDHYAALQAWREWAENQERRGPDPEAESDDRPASTNPLDGRPTIRAEAEHPSFAPFSPRFARQSRPAEGVEPG